MKGVYRKYWVFFLAALFTVAFGVYVGAQVRTVEEEIKDFSGGLVNSVSTELMKNNQALILDNFDITPIGALTPRNGFGSFYNDTMFNYPGQGIFAYYGVKLPRALLVLRKEGGVVTKDTASGALGALYQCDDDNAVCTTLVDWGYYYTRGHPQLPFSSASFVRNNVLILANKKTELKYWNGEHRYYARPEIPGQPEAYAIDSVVPGDGGINGIVRYRYKYTNAGCHDASAPSWYVQVNDGVVWVRNLIPLDSAAAFDSILLYREDNLSGIYICVDTLTPTDTSIIDTLSIESLAARGDTLDETELYNDPSISNTDDSCSPGGLIVAVDSNGTDTIGMSLDTTYTSIGTYNLSPNNYWVIYAAVFVDQNNRQSYMTPLTKFKMNLITESKNPCYASISNIPVAPSGIDSAQFKYKFIVRAYVDPNKRFTKDMPAGYYDGVLYRFYILDTLAMTTTTYTDTIPWEKHQQYLAEFCEIPHLVEYDSAYVSDSTKWFQTVRRRAFDGVYSNRVTTWEIQNGYCYDDSVITFRPSYIAWFSQRYFAVGDPAHKNYLYFSDFAKHYSWPAGKLISLPSAFGDWFTGLVPYGQHLLIFRQNSILSFTGQNFYQYRLEEITNSVGATAPNALAGSQTRVMVPHITGIYELPGDLETPVSLPIENSIDSAGTKMISAWGGFVKNDYWISLPISGATNDKTYIYSKIPRPHWKAYTVGFFDGTRYDYQSNNADYRATRWVFIADNDSIYTWDYGDSYLDGGADSITCKWQSKVFFDEGSTREKIEYVDVEGSGELDGLTISLYDDKGATLIDSKTISSELLTAANRHRVSFNRIVDNCSIRLTDVYNSQYTITAVIIGYQPWDGGKR